MVCNFLLMHNPFYFCFTLYYTWIKIYMWKFIPCNIFCQFFLFSRNVKKTLSLKWQRAKHVVKIFPVKGSRYLIILVYSKLTQIPNWFAIASGYTILSTFVSQRCRSENSFMQHLLWIVSFLPFMFKKYFQGIDN